MNDQKEKEYQKGIKILFFVDLAILLICFIFAFLTKVYIIVGLSLIPLFFLNMVIYITLHVRRNMIPKK